MFNEVKQASNDWIVDAAKKATESASSPLKKSEENIQEGISILKDNFKPFMPVYPKPLPDIKIHLSDVNPKELINNLRDSQGIERYQKLMNFGDELKDMSKDQLKTTRDYLVTYLTQPDNKDDALLGMLLNKVNEELDSREYNPIELITKPSIIDIVKQPTIYFD